MATKGMERKHLVTSIVEAMEHADPTWGLSWQVVDTRLDNRMKISNKEAAAAAAAEARTEVAEAEGAEAEGTEAEDAEP